MSDDIPKAIWSGSFTLFGAVLKVHVLDDGQRVIEADDLDAFFTAMSMHRHETPEDRAEFDRFVRWQAGIDLQ